MAYIRSANPENFKPITGPGSESSYIHGADTRKHYIPLAFQVTSPYDWQRVLLPHALVAHVNPSSIGETFNKKVERIQTRGGFVEQHWGDDLAEMSIDQSTGAFMNLYTGLSSVLRQRTIAWDRYRDLYDLYRNNGSVYNPSGEIVRQGWILLMYDRGIYVGTFRNFSVDETDDSPFAFKLSYTFKVEHVIQKIPLDPTSAISRGGAAIQGANGKNIPITSQGLTYSDQIKIQSDNQKAAEERDAQAKQDQLAAANAILNLPSKFSNFF